MKEWHEVYELPPAGNMMQPGPKGRDVFIDFGNKISSNILDAAASVGGFQQGMRILEFGCGVGRIVMPLYYRHKLPTDCCDVSPWCIGFIKRQVPGANPVKTENLPPLPYQNATFDFVYSVSVWTHLPLDLQWPWLREINRILKPGGYALISTSGFRALRYRREQRKQKGWRGVTDDDLRLEGCIYKPSDPKNHDGVEGEYGYVAHDPAALPSNWGRLFDFIETREAAILSMQDLSILRKNREIGPTDLDLLGRFR